LVNAIAFWFSLLWFVAGSALLQMWTGAHLITFLIGFILSFGVSVSQAEHIPEVIYRASQFGTRILFLIPISTGFRAISDAMLPAGFLYIGDIEMSSSEVFTYASSLAIGLFILYTITGWLAEKKADAG
jgi:hypothetical protein